MAGPPTRADAVSSSSDPQPRRRSRWPVWLLLIVLVVLAAGWGGWRWWQGRQADERAARSDAQLRLDALDQRVQALRRDLRANREQLRQTEATNRVLREELLGIGERAALLEDSLDRLVDPERQGAQALRLDEAELLLSQGRQRLQIAGDLEGARVAYALAAGVLETVDDPAFLSLRQSLAQERAELQALQADPRVRALAALERFARELRPPSSRPRGEATDSQPWWRRAFAALVQVQPSGNAVATAAGDQAAARAALQLELTLARAAAERRDERAWRNALQRTGVWLQRLWPASAALEQRRARLRELAAMPLSPSLATLGSTLQQLRQLRGSGPARPVQPLDAGSLDDGPDNRPVDPP
jgi:uroporphyrin-3 C-methyltransferase